MRMRRAFYLLGKRRALREAQRAMRDLEASCEEAIELLAGDAAEAQRELAEEQERHKAIEAGMALLLRDDAPSTALH
jgi:hypothetical protein